MPLQPHRPGEIFDPALHGHIITPAAVCSARYDFAGSGFANWCDHRGLPIGIPIPKKAYGLIRDAYAEAIGYSRDAEVVARLLDKARAVIAGKNINYKETA